MISEGTKRFIEDIAKKLKIEIPRECYENQIYANKFIEEHKKQAYNAQKKFIIENLPLPKMLDLLGLKKDKQKSCTIYPVYKETDGNTIICHYVKPSEENNPYNVEKNYFVFFMPTGVEPQQFNIKNLKQATNINKNKKLSGGGTIIEYILNRTINYDYKDVLNMLEDIAKDENNASKYGLETTNIKNNDYNINESVAMQEKYNNWIKSYKTIRAIKNQEELQKLESRGLNFYDDIVNMTELSHSIKITRMITPKQKAFEEQEKKYGRGSQGVMPNDYLFEISCPTYTLSLCKDPKTQKVDISGFLSGDQRIKVLTSNFFNIVRERLKNDIVDSNFIKKIEALDKDDLKLTIMKLSKINIPQDLFNNKNALNMMAYLLIVKCQKIDDITGNIEKEFWGFTDAQKRMRKNSIRGVSIFGCPKNESANENDRTILIVENPVLDGFSAIKLGYFDKNKTTIMGTFGNPSDTFYNSLKAFLSARLIHYKTISISTDRDEAGFKFYNAFKEKIYEIYKEIFSSIVKSQEVLSKINSMQELQESCKNILEDNLLKQDDSKEIIKAILDTKIIRTLPRDENCKDFNEELVKKIVVEKKTEINSKIDKSNNITALQNNFPKP